MCREGCPPRHEAVNQNENMGLQTLRPYWKDLLSSPRKERIFDELDANIIPNRLAHQEYLILKSRYENMKADNRRGFITPEEFDAERNRWVANALDFLDGLQDGDIKGEEFSQSDYFVYGIRDIIHTHMDIKEDLGLVHLVNCNRREAKDAFWDAFDEKTERRIPFQFYFVIGDPYQMPHSFSERMVYEIIHSELDDEDTAIHLVLEQDTGRVRVEDLPEGRKLSRHQDAFKKYFSRRFAFQQDTDFDAYLKTGLPRLEYEYVTFVFQTSDRNWTRDHAAYLEWLMSSFEDTQAEMPTFVFLFVLRMQGMSMGLSPNQQKIMDEVAQLCNAHEKATHLPPLPPVEEDDLLNWLYDIGVDSPNKQRILVDAFVKGIPRTDSRRLQQYLEHKLLDMDDIQHLQEIIYSYYNEQTAGD